MPLPFSRRRNLLADDQPLGPDEDAQRGLADDVIGWASPMKARDPDEARGRRNASALDAAANGAVEAQREEMLSRTVSAKAVREKLVAWPVPDSRELNAKDKPGEGKPNFGETRQGSKGPTRHGGIDIKAAVGSPVVAAGDGRVVNVSTSSSFGVQVIIDHGGGVFSQYAHLSGDEEDQPTPVVKVGDEVRSGQLLAYVGRSGNVPVAGDSHLHFEVRLEDSRPRAGKGSRAVLIDGLKYLPDHDRTGGRSESRPEGVNSPVGPLPY